jgi:nucleoside-diphosphate-sugar epimerase
MLDAWAEGRPLRLPQEEFWLDLLHVEDTAAAFIRAGELLHNDLVPGGTLTHYSVCSGRDVSSLELVGLVARIGGRELLVERGSFDTMARAIRRPERGTVLPGWRPSVTLEDGIARLLASRSRK